MHCTLIKLVIRSHSVVKEFINEQKMKKTKCTGLIFEWELFVFRILCLCQNVVDRKSVV